MLKDFWSSDNLFVLSHLYARRAGRLLQKLAQPLPSSLYPERKSPLLTELINTNFRYFLSRNYGAKIIDMENWAQANETVLRQCKGLNWQDSYERLDATMGDSLFIIPKKPEDNPNWQPLAALQGNGPIKPLKIYKWIGIRGREPVETHTPKIGHFGFLVEAINKITGITWPKLTGTVEKFISDNLQTLNKIRSQFQTEPRELGQGSDGIAYDIGPDRVLKIFHSTAAYEAAKNAMNRLWKTPPAAGTEAMIYDIGELGSIFTPATPNRREFTYHIYYYIMEKMTPARSVIDKLTLGTFIDLLWETAINNANLKTLSDQYNYAVISKDNNKISEISAEIKKQSGLVASEVKQINPELISHIEQLTAKQKLKSNWLAKLSEEIIWKLITDRTDLHGGNLGITPNGEFRYFDPVYG